MWPFKKQTAKKEKPYQQQIKAAADLTRLIAQEKTDKIGSCQGCGARSYSFNMDFSRYRCQYCNKLGKV